MKSNAQIIIIKVKPDKTEILWKLLSKRYFDYYISQTEKNTQTFFKAYKRYKDAGGIRTIKSGEELLKINNDEGGEK